VTTIEKGILGMIGVLLIAIAVGVTYMFNAVEEAGGLKQVVIDAGRDVKDIAQEIKKD